MIPKKKSQVIKIVNKKEFEIFVPAQTRKYESRTMKKMVFADGIGTEIFLSFNCGGSRNRKGIL